jgi:CMP-N,N'-diacetyllegionaminic acid synthase
MEILGVVPARGGSKGIPRKNLAVIAGKSLLAWTADAAHASARLTRVIVSTDDTEIAQAARLLNLEVPFMRPSCLAADDTPILAVLEDVLSRLADVEHYVPDIVVLLQPTSPLRRAHHIDRAVDLLCDSGVDTVVSVVRVPHNFNPSSVLHETGGRVVPWGDKPTVTRRQDKPTLYARNGPAVVAVREPVLKKYKSLYGQDTCPLEMTREESIDIDEPWDLELATWLIQREKMSARDTEDGT